MGFFECVEGHGHRDLLICLAFALRRCCRAAQDGFAKLGANAVLEHHFDPETLGQILRFDAAERTQALVKELKKAATNDGERRAARAE